MRHADNGKGLRNQANMHRHVTNAGMDALDQGDIADVAVNHLALVNGDVLATVCCQQPGEQAQKGLCRSVGAGLMP
jgi:hypothetical protein